MNKLDGYALYMTPYCPFCVMVVNAMKELKIEMEMRDTTHSKYRKELQAGGGRTTVPCLKHPDGTWQYESRDIIAFLQTKVA